MLMLLQAAGAQKQLWYALVDEKWFPTMGLLTTTGGSKPSGDAFAFATHRLAPLGPARRIGHGDPTLFHFRIGNRFDVIWGTPRSLAAANAVRAYRADGSAIPLPADVTEEPVAIEGASRIDFGEPQVLADSLYGFAKPPLQWLARRTDTGIETPLSFIDWQWTSYLGSPNLQQMMVNPGGIGPALKTSAVVRYVATEAKTLYASVCLVPKLPTGEVTTAALRQNDTTVWSTSVGPQTGKRSGIVRIEARPGDRIELEIPPGQAPATERMKYLFRISREASSAAEC
jgi:hypothetical protein